MLTEGRSGQRTRLSSRKACEPAKRKADYEGRSTSTYESQRTTTSYSPCTKTTLDSYILACNHTLSECIFERDYFSVGDTAGCAPITGDTNEISLTPGTPWSPSTSPVLAVQCGAGHLPYRGHTPALHFLGTFGSVTTLRQPLPR